MRLLRVNPTGCGPYNEASTIELTGCGLVLLRGINKDKQESSNGSGKTWIFNTISLCLYGRVESFAEGSIGNALDDVINEYWGRGCCARVELEDDHGTIWRITYTRKFKGNPPYANDSPLYPYKGTDIYLERYAPGDDDEPGEWIDERAAEMPNTRKRILQVIGLSYERFIATTYLPQGRGFAFLRGSHNDRAKIISDILDLSLWDEAQVKAKQTLDSHEKELAKAELAAAQLRGEMAATQTLSQDKVSELAAQLEMAKSQIVVLEQHRVEANHALHDALQTLATLEAGNNPVTVAKAKLAAKFHTEHTAASNQRHQILLKLQEAQNAEKKLYPPGDESLNTPQIITKREQVSSLSASCVAAVCPTCTQPWDATQANEQYQAALQQLQDLERKADLSLRDAVAKHIRDITTLHATIEQLAQQLEAVNATLFELESSYQVARLAIPFPLSTEEVQAQVIARQADLDKADTDLHDYNYKVAYTRNAIEHNTVAVQKLQALSSSYNSILDHMANTRSEIAAWSWITRHLGSQGCKSWRIEGVVLRLNQILGEVLTSLDPNLTVALTTSKTKTNGDRQAEIAITVADGHKKAVPIYLYSGGEVSLIAFAILIALWKLADEQGKGTGLLLLDEAVSALDPHNATLATSYIETLRSADRTVVVVSHAQCVDQLAFDQHWTAIKLQGISTIEVSQHAP